MYLMRPLHLFTYHWLQNSHPKSQPLLFDAPACHGSACCKLNYAPSYSSSQINWKHRTTSKSTVTSWSCAMVTYCKCSVQMTIIYASSPSPRLCVRIFAFSHFYLLLFILQIRIQLVLRSQVQSRDPMKWSSNYWSGHSGVLTMTFASEINRLFHCFKNHYVNQILIFSITSLSHYFACDGDNIAGYFGYF